MRRKVGNEHGTRKYNTDTDTCIREHHGTVHTPFLLHVNIEIIMFYFTTLHYMKKERSIKMI